MGKATLTRQLRMFEEQLLKTEVRKSRSDLESLLADEFVEFASDGRAYDKEQVILALQYESPSPRSISDFRIAVLSDDIVLATYEVVRENSQSGEVVRSLRSSIWRRSGHRWQLIFHQGTIQPVP